MPCLKKNKIKETLPDGAAFFCGFSSRKYTLYINLYIALQKPLFVTMFL